MDTLKFHSNRFAMLSVLLLAIATFALQIIFAIIHPINLAPTIWLLVFSGLTAIFLCFLKKYFRVMFLLASFTMITAWRLNGLANYNIIVYCYLAAAILMLVNFILCAYYNIERAKAVSREKFLLSASTWQLMFIRLYVGLDLVPHFCEKLFAGASIRAQLYQGFANLGVEHHVLMVWFAGFMELAGAFAISTGFFTRIGAIGLTLYMLIATAMGHHFGLGFMWATPGGGWEYPAMWTIIFLSFAVFGGGVFSLDFVIKEKLRPPRWLGRFMGVRIR